MGDGEPLSLEHGAPIRLVAPAHYGYKNVKHLCRIDFQRERNPGSAGWLEHARGRVALEERSDLLPAWLARRLYRALLPATLRAYRRAGRRA